MGDASVRRAIGPRLVSPSVRAAEKLPPTIKKQSVKNQLLRGGAKPAELDYARLDQWLDDQDADRVAAEDVVRHLGTRGPLARIKRLDAEGDDKGTSNIETYSADEDEDAYYNIEVAKSEVADMPRDEKMFTEAHDVYGPRQRPLRPNDAARPFESTERAWPFTQHGEYTETDAWDWNPNNYREVMWFDPETGRSRGIFSPNAYPVAVDTHEGHVWVRYHNNPNAIDVQNIQSDMGQSAEQAAMRKMAAGQLRDIVEGYRALRRMRGEEAGAAADDAREFAKRLLSEHDGRMPWDTDQGGNKLNPLDLARRVAAGNWHTYPVDAYDLQRILGDVGATEVELQDLAQNAENVSERAPAQWVLNLPPAARAELLAKFQRMGQLKAQLRNIEHHGNRFGGVVNERGFLHTPIAQYSTGSAILDGGGWRQLPLRHLLLESAVQDGKPIHLPLGINVTAVENMPRGAARRMYEQDAPRSLIRTLRGIGGGDVKFIPGENRQLVPYLDNNGNRKVYTLRTGPNGQRAGTVITPSPKAVDHINKHGLDFLSLLLLAGAGTGAAMNSQPQPAQGQVQ